jgi:hypothetical protein
MVVEDRQLGHQRAADSSQADANIRSLPMAYPDYIKHRARALRLEKHLTLDELVERLALPRTTIYYWIRDLPLGKPRRWSAGQRKGNMAMQAKYRRLREYAYAQGLSEYDQLAEAPTFRDFVVLYIAEGYKFDRNVVAIGNSDPRLVQIACTWLGRVSTKRLNYAVQYHAAQDLAELREYWGQLLGIERSAIGVQRKSNSGQLRGRRWRCAHGVLTVRVYDTLLRARLQAWIDRVRDDWVRVDL